MAKKGVSRISISLPPDLLDEFDKIIKQMGYDRSKAIQISIRNFLTENKWMHEEKGIVMGALAMIYDHEVKGLEESLTDAQHLYSDIISSSMHIHLDERNCLEIIAVKGKVESIRDLTQELMSKRGVKQIRLAIVTP
ncbi:MAG: nickel-responsive transcriptional regulator NikR [archaeon]|nr:nickel-responsive transcriptional regulator NikR [archaeon]MCP8313614.1 nickel-responsive transcriptional regulator NikR [archaeon]MCP8316374.1 nickel-responsive transcriptional regulator NikR [archaeon]MCP8321695.1 nickel-responsive transcriptional regulator NikR [archaeon]